MDTGTSDPRSGPRWRRRKEARPGEILAAALETFVERGYESARLEDIARHAGCTKGTIFLYYESKAELFKAVVRDIMVPLLEESEQAIETHQGNARDLLEKLLRMRWDAATAARLSGLAKLLFAETERYPELARFYYDEIHSHSQALIRRAFDLGVAQGEFRPLDSASVARVVIAPIVFASIWRHSFGPIVAHAVDSEAYFKTIIDVLLSGLQLVPVHEEAQV